MEISDTSSGCLDDDAIYTSETLTGERERAPAAGVLPTQSVAKKGRFGDRHLAFVTDKEAAKAHAQRWRPDMKEKIDTQTRMDPGASLVLGGGGPVLSTCAAEDCDRMLGQELTETEERAHADF